MCTNMHAACQLQMAEHLVYEYVDSTSNVSSALVMRMIAALVQLPWNTLDTAAAPKLYLQNIWEIDMPARCTVPISAK